MINLYLFAFNNRPMSRDIWKSKFGLDCIGPCYTKVTVSYFYVSPDIFIWVWLIRGWNTVNEEEDKILKHGKSLYSIFLHEFVKHSPEVFYKKDALEKFAIAANSSTFL